jgi:hypothetical protein
MKLSAVESMTAVETVAPIESMPTAEPMSTKAATVPTPAAVMLRQKGRGTGQH